MGKTTIGIRLDETTHDRIKAAASRIDRTPYWLVKKAIISYLEKLEKDEIFPKVSLLLSDVTEEDLTKEEEIFDSSRKKHSPFFYFSKQILPQSASRYAVTSAYLRDETNIIPELLKQARLPQLMSEQIHNLALRLAKNLRSQKSSGGQTNIVQKLLHEFSLSSQEGIALMCLSEALLRIPDNPTRNALIRDKINNKNWKEHLGKNSSLFVNIATWCLLLSCRLISNHEKTNSIIPFNSIIKKGGKSLVRRGMSIAMHLLGKQFITGETITEAITRARNLEKKGFRYSFDMLGEAAITTAQAQDYMHAYQEATIAIGKASNGRGIYEGPSISVKLSALHPRYHRAHYDRITNELYPRLKLLVILARQYDISINIDAEESERLEISLDLLKKLCFEPELKGWNGIGIAVQAYQKRCPFVIDYLIDLASRSHHRLLIRLVKGAYWDSEIKRAQIEGLEGYPVYTRKVYTDISYLACAKKLLSVPNLVYPQFATHNIHTLSTIYHLAGKSFHTWQYEFQCLHGMGETLYKQVIGKKSNGKLNRPCRIYAPVGTHKTLLAYLVRRLLENGANTSFVNRIADAYLPLDKLLSDPVKEVDTLALKEGKIGIPNPKIPLPRDLYGKFRTNSSGIDLSNEHALFSLSSALLDTVPCQWQAKSILEHPIDEGEMRPILNPADPCDIVGFMQEASEKEVEKALKSGVNNARIWFSTSPHERAEILERAAVFMEEQRQQLIGLLIREAGKTFTNAISEVREAIDFLRYYAKQVRINFDNKTHLPLGLIVCISPWNFPLAIFIGQIAAALATGNAVLAKPAEQTPLIAFLGINILLKAGVPNGVIQLLLGRGETIGTQLSSDPRVSGVMFTGSIEVAKLLQRIVTTRLNSKGFPTPLIAETGGMNAMIVDSSALTEQVVVDVISSAFDSAGQRCSSLRVLCLQEEIADYTLKMLREAMKEFRMGNPNRLTTDIGPLIDAEAQSNIERHILFMREKGFSVFQAANENSEDTIEWNRGTFIIPTLIELSNFSDLKKEIFGPVLHVVRYKKKNLLQLIEQINSSGYGLTLGIHTRIDETIAKISDTIKVGNIYVNRNMVGAVVGVQPFGGEGLSGTGPKAGGPLYLYRLLSKYPDDAFLTTLMRQSIDCTIDSQIKEKITKPVESLKVWLENRPVLHSLCERYIKLSQSGTRYLLPGPTGEKNIWSLFPRNRVLCIADNESDVLVQLAATMSIGCEVLWEKDELHCKLKTQLPKVVSTRIYFIEKTMEKESFDVAMYHGDSDKMQELCKRIATRDGAIIPFYGFRRGETNLHLEAFYLERSLTINTTAAGGNATLMTMS